MVKFFPLNLVIFPEEKLNLHIFEPRYIQLINDALKDNATFGIPVFMNKEIKNRGIEVEIVEVSQHYSDGKMDIKTVGKRLFKVQSMLNPIPEKLYAGGTVEYISCIDDASFVDRSVLVDKVQELYSLMKVKMEINSDKDFLSFELAHKIGFSIEQEFMLMEMESEKKRLDFMITHLMRAIPIVREVEKTKERIKLNGHFKNIIPPKF